MDLGSWLKSLGLAQYEAAFRENATLGFGKCATDALGLVRGFGHSAGRRFAS
jgi:hypothetical protein